MDQRKCVSAEACDQPHHPGFFPLCGASPKPPVLVQPPALTLGSACFHLVSYSGIPDERVPEISLYLPDGRGCLLRISWGTKSVHFKNKQEADLAIWLLEHCVSGSLCLCHCLLLFSSPSVGNLPLFKSVFKVAVDVIYLDLRKAFDTLYSLSKLGK